MSGIFYIVIWSDSFWLFREIVDNKMGRREGWGAKYGDSSEEMK